MLMLKKPVRGISYSRIVEALPDNVRMLYFGGTIYIHMYDVLKSLGLARISDLTDLARIYDLNMSNATHRGTDLYVPYGEIAKLCCYLHVDPRYNQEVAKRIAFSLYYEPDNPAYGEREGLKIEVPDAPKAIAAT